jgi:phosphoglycerate dehydrogenase-like enzyme
MPLIAVLLPSGARKRNLSPEAEQSLTSWAKVRWVEKEEPLSEQEKSEFIKDAEGVITGWAAGPLTVNNYEAAKSLRIVGVIGSSVQHLAPLEAMDRGIVICNTAAAIGHSVAEFALTQILCLLKDMVENHQVVAGGGWRSDWEERPARDLWGRKVGLIGLGACGRIMARLLKGFNCEILGYDPYLPGGVAGELGVKMVDLETLLKESEIISLHAGRTQETKKMINRETLALLQDGAILVNTSRGALIDEEALAEKVKEGKIKVALDVFEPEPPAVDSPLRKLPNVLLSPHVAGGTWDTLERVGWAVVEDMKRFFEGKEPLNKLTRTQVLHAT